MSKNVSKEKDDLKDKDLDLENDLISDDSLDPENDSNFDDSFDFEAENEIDVSNTKLENKTFGIQSIISDFEYRLRGFNWKANGDKYVYCGNPLAGKKTIQKIILLLDPFSKAVNMISNKKNYTWQKQLLRTRLALASILTNAYDSDLKNYKEIWRTFSNLMFNIGDVILEKNSQKMLSGFFGIGEDYKGEEMGRGPKGKDEGDIYG